MLHGHVRDSIPYVTPSLPGHDCLLMFEFVIDTGFNGDLAVPAAILRQLDAAFSFEKDVLMADGSRRRCPYYEIILDWNDATRLTEVMVLEGNPLLGGDLLEGFLSQVEMTAGGQVLIEPL